MKPIVPEGPPPLATGAEARSDPDTLERQPRRLRIVFLTNLYPPFSIGGYEQICQGVANGLIRRGHAVSVVTSAYRAGERADDEHSVYRVLRLESGFGPPTRTGTSRGLLRRPSVEWRNGRQLRRLLRQLMPEVCVCWNAAKLGGAVLSALEEHGPVAYYLSDDWMATLLAYQGAAKATLFARLRRAYRRGLRLAGLPDDPVRANRLIFCSHALLRQYERRGAALDHPTVIYHGVAPELFSFQPQHILQRAQRDALRLLYVGQITPQKGVLTLVTALRRLRELPGGDCATLTLAGARTNAAFEAQLRAQIASLGLQEAVTWLPAQPREHLPSLYAAHDAFAFPSEWEEPFSVALLEAMAIGIPVVASLRGGSAEIVRHQQNAVAFEAGDAIDLAHKLAWVAEHPLQAAALGERASKYVGESFTLTTETLAIERYLQGLLCSR